MYAIHVHFHDGRIQTVNKTTLAEAYLCYSEWKKDSRVIRVTLYATYWLHLSSFHADLGEEHDDTPIVFAGRGEGTA